VIATHRDRRRGPSTLGGLRDRFPGRKRVMAIRCGTIVDVVSWSNWLDRYRRGQRGRVWHELRQFGGTIREPGLFGEAQLVCDEMARRARHNVEVIVERLSSDGYRFHSNDDAQTPVSPTSRRRPRRRNSQIGWRNASAPYP
jgi:hypothetical protein